MIYMQLSWIEKWIGSISNAIRSGGGVAFSLLVSFSFVSLSDRSWCVRAHNQAGAPKIMRLKRWSNQWAYLSVRAGYRWTRPLFSEKMHLIRNAMQTVFSYAKTHSPSGPDTWICLLVRAFAGFVIRNPLSHRRINYTSVNCGRHTDSYLRQVRSDLNATVTANTE